MDKLQRLAAAAIGAALAGRNLDQALAGTWSAHPHLSPAERATVQDLAFGTLRHYGLLAAVLEQLAARPPGDERLRCLLLAALYQLEFTRAKPFVVVDHAVRATEALGLTPAKGMSNAILRNFLRGREALLAQARRRPEARHGHPRWWIDKLRADYPKRWQAMLAAGNLAPPMTLRVNLRRITVADYLASLERAGIAAQPLAGAAVRLARPLPVARLAGFAEGLASVQDYSAQQAAGLMDLADGQRVLDACSAPGGKTGHILESADVALTALDSDPARLARVQDNLDRLGLAARLVCADAADLSAWWDGEPFDRVLLDAPCSGSGVVKRHPDIKWGRRPTDLAGFAAGQDRLLDALWQVLRVGGKLCYATCSVFREENHQRIAAFLSCHGDVSPLPVSLPDAPDGQIVPDDQHDGFYYAILAKL